MSAIAVDQLRKTYRSGLLRRRRLEALRGISFRVERGEIFGLLGPNGAGKTTFMKILLGIVRRSGGQASLLGRPAGDRAGRLRVGYLPENLIVPRHLTARTALYYYGKLSRLPAPQIKKRQPELLELVGLSGRERDSVRQYSKGMLQRLGLAQALLHDPDLLILDEPTDGLDPVGRSQVRSILAGLKQQGKTIFLNSHLLQEVELICDRVAILDRGTLRYVGSVQEITSQQEGISAQQPAWEIELVVSGAEAVIREAFDGQQVARWTALGPQQFQIQMRVADQAAVDRSIDELRRRGVSLISLSRRRVTLEDAFMKLVARSADLT